MDFNIDQKLRESLKEVLRISNTDATAAVKKIAEDLEKVNYRRNLIE